MNWGGEGDSPHIQGGKGNKEIARSQKKKNKVWGRRKNRGRRRDFGLLWRENLGGGERQKK